MKIKVADLKPVVAGNLKFGLLPTLLLLLSIQQLHAYEVKSEFSKSEASDSQLVASQDSADDEAEAAESQDARYASFEELLSGTKLIGTFTIDGQDLSDLNEEEYIISSVSKMERGDYWKFEARVRYGERDYELPIPLEVKWAGDTPVITLTDLTFLGQGPFSARVLFYDDKYVGTWSHGEVGGHMFGRLEKVEEADE